MHLLYIQLVTKHYTCGFPAPGNCTLLLWAHLWSSCLGNASQLYANRSYLNIAWRPCVVRWLFSRTICTMTLLRDFTTKPPTHSPAVSLFGCIYQPTSPCPTFLLTLNQSPKDNAGSDITNCLTHTCYSYMTGYIDIGGLSWHQVVPRHITSLHSSYTCLQLPMSNGHSCLLGAAKTACYCSCLQTTLSDEGLEDPWRSPSLISCPLYCSVDTRDYSSWYGLPVKWSGISGKLRNEEDWAKMQQKYNNASCCIKIGTQLRPCISCHLQYIVNRWIGYSGERCEWKSHHLHHTYTNFQ